MYICLCSGLKTKELKKLIREENADMKMIINRTGATTKCGKCLTSINKILKEEQETSKK